MEYNKIYKSKLGEVKNLNNHELIHWINKEFKLSRAGEHKAIIKAITKSELTKRAINFSAIVDHEGQLALSDGIEFKNDRATKKGEN